MWIDERLSKLLQCITYCNAFHEWSVIPFVPHSNNHPVPIILAKVVEREMNTPSRELKRKLVLFSHAGHRWKILKKIPARLAYAIPVAMFAISGGSPGEIDDP